MDFFFLFFPSLKCYVVLGLCSGILSLLLITAFDWYRFIILFPLTICRVLGMMQNKCKAILCSQKIKDLLGRTRIHIIRTESSEKWCSTEYLLRERKEIPIGVSGETVEEIVTGPACCRMNWIQFSFSPRTLLSNVFINQMNLLANPIKNGLLLFITFHSLHS